MEKFTWENYERPLTEEEIKAGKLSLSIQEQIKIKNYCRENEIMEFLAENHDIRAFENIAQAAQDIREDQEEYMQGEDITIADYLENNEIEDRETALKNIDEFCQSEYGNESADITDLHKISIAYTEGGIVLDDEDLNCDDLPIPIQVEVDLINHSLETYINNEHIQTINYESVQDMNINLLEGMDFDSLVSCGDFSAEEQEATYRTIYDFNKDVQTTPFIKDLSDEGNYYSGTFNIDCYQKPIPFDYNKETENLDLHNYSNPGWMTGACYDQELTPFIQANWNKIFDDISCVLNDKNKVQELLTNAKASDGKGGK